VNEGITPAIVHTSTVHTFFRAEVGPETIRISPSLEIFKTRLDKVLCSLV